MNVTADAGRRGDAGASERVVLLNIPGVPFGANDAIGMNPYELNKKRRQIKSDTRYEWFNAGSPEFTKARISAVMVFEVERDRDADNYAGGGSLKSVIDALKGRAWPDDTPQYVVPGEVTFRVERGRGKARMLVSIEEIGAQP